MVDASTRAALCGIIGLVAGSVLGVLFVPDPTGVLAAAVAVVSAALIGGGLYRSDWLREGTV